MPQTAIHYTASATRPPPGPVTDILDRLADAAEGERLSLGAAMEALGPASFTPLMLAPALAVVSPLSGIPFVSSLCGLTIALFAAQMLARRRHAWAPGWLMRRRLPAARVRGAVDGLRRPVGWLERVARPRLEVLVTPPFRALPQLACLAAGLAMPFLELVPFSSSLLGTAVVILGVAMLTRDGVLALLGLVPFAAAGGVISAILPS